MRSRGPSRRRFLGAATGVAVTSALAGCLGNGDDGTDPTADEDDPAAWEDVREIRLMGYTRGWVGDEPELIDGITNPTIVLFEGEEYEITWENGDGGRHNIEIWDEEDAVVDGLATDLVTQRGATQSIQFTASPEAHQYVCEPHFRTMVGYFRHAGD